MLLQIHAQLLQTLADNKTRNYAKHQGAMANKETRAKWNKFAEEHAQFFTSNADKWDQYFEQLHAFLQQHERRPLNSKLDEKSLAKWLDNQTQNHIKHQQAMANGGTVQKRRS